MVLYLCYYLSRILINGYVIFNTDTLILVKTLSSWFGLLLAFLYTGYDEDDDFVLDKDEYFDDDDSLAKIFIVKGSSGCFKTSTVHTCAREAGFKVSWYNTDFHVQ